MCVCVCVCVSAKEEREEAAGPGVSEDLWGDLLASPLKLDKRGGF